MNEKNTLCPMFSAGAVLNKCLKEACEWWVEDKQRCAVAVIGAKRDERTRNENAFCKH